LKLLVRSALLFLITAFWVPANSIIAFETYFLSRNMSGPSETILTVTADNLVTIYGDAIPVFTFTYSGFLGNDSPDELDSPPTCNVEGSHTNVGTYPIVCSGGTDSKYTFSYIDGSLTVGQKPLIIAADNLGKTYGNTYTFSGTEFTTTGLLPGDTVTSVTLSSTGASAQAPSGIHPIVPGAAVGTGLGNYIIIYSNGTMTVGGNILNIIATNQAKIYGEPFTFAGNEFTVVGLNPGDHVTSMNITSIGAPASAEAGTSPIIPSAAVGIGLINYIIIYHNGQMVVNQRELTFTPDNKSKVVGELFTSYTGAFIGLMPFDNITPSYYSRGARTAATVGIYPITATLNDPDHSLRNYTFTAYNGILTVIPISLHLPLVLSQR